MQKVAVQTLKYVDKDGKGGMDFDEFYEFFIEKMKFDI